MNPHTTSRPSPRLHSRQHPEQHAAQPAYCAITPPYLLARLTEVEDEQVVSAATRTLATDQRIRDRREVFTERGRGGVGSFLPGAMDRTATLPPPDATTTSPAEAVQRAIYDAASGTALPGTEVRAEGAPATDDEGATEAYDGLGATWELYHSAYGRNSLDDKGLLLLASVHYDRDYDNAFWNGEQMVFGDGDGVYFTRFTAAIDVIGHELTHGFTQYTGGLTYVAQSGALNESISDCFGSMVKQMALGQSAADADWLIGAGLFTDKVQGVALRSMKAPGTAYDDPHLGKDPQPADMSGYQDLPHDAEHDNGGVHTNSGIPNHAFYLAATGIGGTSWEGAGQVWYDVLTSGKMPKDADFAAFAQLTVQAAKTRFGDSSSQAKAVTDAWTTVQVLR